ncbi:MAG: molybdopterin-dependent oxidoreductase [Acidimicrobiia bacterium]|nr:molybdopterin-dependent oxidoreductase [Acidimicrobiia bacterium]
MAEATSPTATEAESGTGIGRLGRLTGRQVNLLLELLIAGALLTGLLSWWAGDRWNGWLVVAHAISGLSIAFAASAKLRGPVRAGFKRRRRTRWLSSAFGVLVLATLGLGMLHSTGIWYGVGYWSAMWTHQLFGFALIPLLVWHVASRPVRPKVTDVDRRSFLRTGAIAGGAAGLYVGQRAIAGVVGPASADRRHTGSYEVASFDPANLPRVSWINDSRPADTSPDAWAMRVNGLVIPIATLWELAGPVSAILDCTGGWWSEQRWDAVPLSMLIPEPTGRSVRVLSSTGYDRYFGHETLDDVYLAVGYGGEPLRAGHGSPVRLVAPGRRGPWWVKWVVEVRDADRPPWWQPPLPLA